MSKPLLYCQQFQQPLLVPPEQKPVSLTLMRPSNFQYQHCLLRQL